DLGGERVYRTAEGERAFAPGDRLLFRENNRDLGVKNGMLGTVAEAGEGRLLVRLDSAQGPGRGRVVAVSLADYAAVDHGYATTIHKAQGATVDRAYVLASGSMDRHLTYVAMTRHRDQVTLYAGRNVFADLEALSARLSRSQAKETTLDYERAAFAQRRGILAASAEMPVPTPAPRARGRFDGLRLGAGRPEPALGGAAPAGQGEEIARVVERYARAWVAVAEMRHRGLPVLEAQDQALSAAGAALDAARPGASQDLVRALKRDGELRQALFQREGLERGRTLLAGIEAEARVRRDPMLRAERFVADWTGLEAARRQASGAALAGVVERQRALAGELKGDAALQGLLRTQARVLGIVAGTTLDLALRPPAPSRSLDRGMERDDGPGWSM
ncbi:ATP-binding domain-containing protein, partial [Nitrospirillum amazonense]|uniref:ATP-binding domain-containing protein n=1 Tax=Nitrospirillum amazonense TaxID=28077 RepID=UPI001FE78AED